jgi:hypothetical protein
MMTVMDLTLKMTVCIVDLSFKNTLIGSRDLYSTLTDPAKSNILVLGLEKIVIERR